MITMTTSVNAPSSLLLGTTPTHSLQKWENCRIDQKEEDFKKQIHTQVSKDYHHRAGLSATERFIRSIMNRESQTNSYQLANHICYKGVIINGNDILRETLTWKTLTVPKHVVLENCMLLDFPSDHSFQFYRGSVYTGRLDSNGHIIVEKLYVAGEEGGAPDPTTIANESKKPSFLSSLCDCCFGCCFGWQTSQNDYESLGEELPSPVRAESNAIDSMSGSHQVPEGEPSSPISTENAPVYDDTDSDSWSDSYQNSHGSANIGANSTTSTTTVNTAQSNRGLRLLEDIERGAKHHPGFMNTIRQRYDPV